jgi:DNA-binding MarR family transcriptional regulator
MTRDAAETNRLHRELATAVVAFQEAVSRRVGMTAAERKCAGLIAEWGVATPGRLAQATGLTSGAITGIVDRLVRAGYARREPNPADRRSVLIYPQKCEELAARTLPAFEALTRAMTELDARYSAAERALIHRHLKDTLAVLRAQIEALGRQ